LVHIPRYTKNPGGDDRKQSTKRGHIAMRQFPLFKIFCKMIKRKKVKMNELYEVVVLRKVRQ